MLFVSGCLVFDDRCLLVVVGLAAFFVSGLVLRDRLFLCIVRC